MKVYSVCGNEWLSLRGNGENTEIVTHYYNNAPRSSAARQQQ